MKVDDSTKVGALKAHQLGGKLFKSYTVDKDGFITKLYDFSDVYGTPATNVEKGVIDAVTGIEKTSKEYTVKVGTTSGENYVITVDEDAKIFSVNTDDEITEISYKGISKDENAKITAYVEDYMVKTLVIYEQDEDAGKTNTPTTYKFDTLVANYANSGDIEFKAATSKGLATWSMIDAEIKYTLTIDGEDAGTYTQSISGTSAFSNLANVMKIENTELPSISDGKHTFNVDVVVSFKGTDTNTYTVGGSATFKSF